MERLSDSYGGEAISTHLGCTKPVVTLMSLPVETKQCDVALAPRPIVVMPRHWIRMSFHPGLDFRVDFPNRIIIERYDPEMGAGNSLSGRKPIEIPDSNYPLPS
jgi:hypothetical protein